MRKKEKKSIHSQLKQQMSNDLQGSDQKNDNNKIEKPKISSQRNRRKSSRRTGTYSRKKTEYQITALKKADSQSSKKLIIKKQDSIHQKYEIPAGNFKINFSLPSVSYEIDNPSVQEPNKSQNSSLKIKQFYIFQIEN